MKDVDVRIEHMPNHIQKSSETDNTMSLLIGLLNNFVVFLVEKMNE